MARNRQTTRQEQPRTDIHAYPGRDHLLHSTLRFLRIVVEGKLESDRLTIFEGIGTTAWGRRERPPQVSQPGDLAEVGSIYTPESGAESSGARTPFFSRTTPASRTRNLQASLV